MTLMPAVEFGTSGLRGRADGFSPAIVFAYVGGFLETVCRDTPVREVLIGRDLRDSSPYIAGLVGGAVEALGWRAVNAGTLPTPALALHALQKNVPAIMVTGSHIPPDHNGLKFYRPDSELLKNDEGPIRAAAQNLSSNVPEFAARLSDVDTTVTESYAARFVAAFAPDVLEGMRIGVYEHTAVGRDLVVRVLTSLGAQCTPLGRSETFIAVDTEAVDTETMARLREALARERFDAIVSADGDGDRPLLVDADGHQVNGDVLGILTSRWLGATEVVTPLTSTSALELSGWFNSVIRTRIGSPYVVEAMGAIAGRAVVGFEANGGFLTDSDLRLRAGVLTRLPTRDALLPLIAVLAQAKARGAPIAALVDELPRRVMKAGRLKNVAPEIGAALVADLAASDSMRADLDPSLAQPKTIDTTDGTRLVIEGDVVVHFRQSGNAPEFRCYVETDGAEKTETVLAGLMTTLAAQLERQVPPSA
jgi:phosphomannomutase